MSNIFDNRTEQPREGFNPNIDNSIKNAQASTIGKILFYLSFIFIIPIFYAVSVNNKFNRLQNRINENASNIDVQLTKRSATLIKMYDSVKGYKEFEKSVLTDITKMRNLSQSLPSTNNQAQREELSALNNSVLGRLIAVSENYPDLKSSTLFKELMEESAYIEREIAASRRTYNSVVNEYNRDLFVYPRNVIASAKHLVTAPLYMASTEERKDVKLEF